MLIKLKKCTTLINIQACMMLANLKTKIAKIDGMFEYCF